MSEMNSIEQALQKSWSKIAPCWPLENIIAVNPLSGFEDLHFQEALDKSHLYFRKKNIPQALIKVNIQTIKWLQLFFDESQATIKMPLKEKGLLRSVYQLMQFERNFINKNSSNFNKIIKTKLSQDTNEVIKECLEYLNIPQDNYYQYFMIILTTLPGWASYIQHASSKQACPTNLKSEYIALRLLQICFIYPEGKELLDGYKLETEHQVKDSQAMETIRSLEKEYRQTLYKIIKESSLLADQTDPKIQNVTSNIPEAQLIFCIDVRSEGMRKTIENLGNYQTYGFAGFFGLPITIDDRTNSTQYASCPVLLSPEYSVTLSTSESSRSQSFIPKIVFTKIYQSLKYNFLTPFGLAESTGFIGGIIIVFKTFFPQLFFIIKSRIYTSSIDLKNSVSFENIPFQQQCMYALNALKGMSITSNFGPLVFLIGHGSQTENNAYASSLDCGACAGRHGGINAYILASILNKNQVRSYLKNQGITIPDSTYFLAAEHNTTTDALKIIDQKVPADLEKKLAQIQKDFLQAQKIYAKERSKKLNTSCYRSSSDTKAKDWAEVRPEWGLAGNASFIIGPRDLTRKSDLDGRSFLHSYDWTLDQDGTILTSILMGPMIVGQWINAQYLFSTLDNTAFGAGSKITHNVTGKIGVMQGNGSDLMNGLPLQSVYVTDTQRYHQPVRLLVVIYAPKELLEKIIQSQELLKKLITNEWILVSCINPADKKLYHLTTGLQWTL
jgi:hypothetical protein